MLGDSDSTTPATAPCSPATAPQPLDHQANPLNDQAETRCLRPVLPLPLRPQQALLHLDAAVRRFQPAMPLFSPTSSVNIQRMESSIVYILFVRNRNVAFGEAASSKRHD
eukprot:TRINITY_DN3988_c0_g1_i5.p1 TRINITY_DN3988_c0_g1~~TRINITY_DN3988_c0_g1_i5.p1  ORF type:complete len:110 (+),score=11.77 TRINITY_DN3988_c0_g1_i5:609-938(+)